MEYSRLYFHLFNAVTDAINKIEFCEYAQAKELLIKAQQEAEDYYFEGTLVDSAIADGEDVAAVLAEYRKAGTFLDNHWDGIEAGLRG